MEYNIGDKIRIKTISEFAADKNIHYNSDKGYHYVLSDGFFTDEMEAFCGREVVISDKYMAEDRNMVYICSDWTDAPLYTNWDNYERLMVKSWMFEPVNSGSEDIVNHPKHYETGKFECIEVMEEAIGIEAVKDFCLCNAFKYLYRCNSKHETPLEDVEKAQWYINKYVELSKKQ